MLPIWVPEFRMAQLFSIISSTMQTKGAKEDGLYRLKTLSSAWLGYSKCDAAAENAQQAWNVPTASLSCCLDKFQLVFTDSVSRLSTPYASNELRCAKQQICGLRTASLFPQ